MVAQEFNQNKRPSRTPLFALSVFARVSKKARKIERGLLQNRDARSRREMTRNLLEEDATSAVPPQRT
jgi:hypothetical protein